jgi:hypothetical protein
VSVYSVNKFKYYNLFSSLSVNVPMQFVTLVGLFLILFVYAFSNYVNMS